MIVKKNRSFFLLVLLTSLLLIGLLVGPYAFKRGKRWQAQRFFDQARQSEAAGDIRTAIQKAEASHRLQPSNHAALMYLARLTLALPEGHPRMDAWWKAAMRTPDCRTEDILGYIEKLVTAGKVSEAYPLVLSLRQLEPDNERAVDLQADILLDERKLVEAETVLRDFLDRNPEASPDTYQRMAEVLLAYASERRHLEAKTFLLDLANSSGEPQLFALRRITRNAMFTSGERADAAEKLLARGDITIADHLTAYNALLEDRRMRRTEIRDKLIALLQDESRQDPDAMARLGAWLINSDQSRYFLQLLTLEESRLDANIYAARLMAMVRAGQAEEVYGMTFDRTDENPLSPVENLLVRAEAAAALERTDEFQTTLQALADSVDGENFRLIEQKLVSYGAWEPLLSAYERLRANERTRALARRKQLLAYYFLGRERDLLTLLEDFDGYLNEEDPPTQALICYLNTLYNREAGETIRIAESLVTRYPNIIDFRITLAFQAYRQNKRSRVEALVGDLPILPRNRERYLQVPMVVLRAYLGDEAAAQPISMELQDEELLPAERVLLRKI